MEMIIAIKNSGLRQTTAGLQIAIRQIPMRVRRQFTAPRYSWAGECGNKWLLIRIAESNLTTRPPDPPSAEGERTE